MNPELLYKYLENRATDAEMVRVLDWLDADPAHQRELDELDRVMAASVVYGPDILTGEMAAKPAKKAGRVLSLRRAVRYAAEAAAALAVAFGLSWMFTQNRIGEWAQQTTTLEVPAGQYLSMKLQDGTTVWLNSGTMLEYPVAFAGRERRVKVSGEAMFEVEHDARHPFIVETFACDIEVLGTRFDVVAEESEGLFSTALLRGSVRVTNRLTPGEQFILKPNEEVRLTGRRLSLETIGSMDDYLWTKGMISLKGLSFGELMRKFEKSFGVRIVIDRSRMPEIDYNHGKIRISDGVDSALRLLQMASDFTYTRSEDDGTIVIR